MHNKLLTIIVLVFNEAKTILQALDEVVKIDIDKEIIVIDNCSTDGTGDLLRKNIHPQIKLVFQSKNLGPGGSLQKGASLATGKYTHFFHADLEYKAHDVHKMLEKAESENLDAVFGSRLALYSNKSWFYILKKRPFFFASLVSTKLINRWYGHKLTDIIATKLIRTDVLRSLNCQTLNQGAEFELASKLCKRGYKVAEVPISYSPRTYKEGKKIKIWDAIPAMVALYKVKILDK